MLKKLKMPKPKEMELDELDLPSDEESSEAPEALEEAEGEEMAEESAEEAGELEAISDEDLLAEVKKRGLLSQMDKEMGEESAEDAYI